MITATDYQTVMDTSLPIEQRLAVFRVRKDWLRVLGTRWLEQNRRMVTEFGNLGVVERRPGPGEDQFPPFLYFEASPVGAAVPFSVHKPVPAGSALDKDARAPHREFLPKVDRYKTRVHN